MFKQSRDTHGEIEILLPWLVNDSLKGRDRERIQTHLIACEECRLTRDRMQTLESLISEQYTTTADYQPAYRKLLKRIDAAERERKVLSGIEADCSGWFNHLHREIHGFFQKIHYTLAMMPLVIGTLLLFPASTTEILWQEQGTYKTLSSENAQLKTTFHKALITFTQDAEPEIIRQVLLESNAKIIHTTNQNNSYLVELISSPDKPLQETLSRLQAMDSVASVDASPGRITPPSQAGFSQ